MSKLYKAYKASFVTDNGTISFCFESEETSIGEIMVDAVEIAHEIIDESRLFVTPIDD